jgi:hypothetical protein
MRLLSVALVLVVVVGIVVAGIAVAGGGGDDERTTPPSPARETATPASLGAFPPAFVECLRDQGIDVASLTGESLVEVIHSPQGNACFGVLHQGGGEPGVP